MCRKYCIIIWWDFLCKNTLFSLCILNCLLAWIRSWKSSTSPVFHYLKINFLCIVLFLILSLLISHLTLIPPSDLLTIISFFSTRVIEMCRLWDVGKSEPIKVGKASPCEGTLPGAIYFILKYKSFKSAAQANAMVGGDNASRAIPIGECFWLYFYLCSFTHLYIYELESSYIHVDIYLFRFLHIQSTLTYLTLFVGIVLGAYEGMSGIPIHWLERMTETAHIKALLDTLPLSNLSGKDLWAVLTSPGSSFWFPHKTQFLVDLPGEHSVGFGYFCIDYK